MRHKEWKMGTMVERIQHVGPSNLLNNMVKVFANTGNTLPPGNLRTFRVRFTLCRPYFLLFIIRKWPRGRWRGGARWGMAA